MSTPWPTAVAPPGAFEPVSGFERVWQHYWRYEDNLPVMVRQDIGWATGLEFEAAHPRLILLNKRW